MKIKLNEIRHNPYNTREDYGDLGGLKTSIEKFGLAQPFIVRRSEKGYELAFGSRRYEALKEMGIKEIDVEIRDINNADMSILSICENVHRKDLNAVEQARAYERGLRATKLSITDFAKTIGENINKIRDYLTILSLPQSILAKPGKYGKMQLIALGRVHNLSTKLRIMVENLLDNKDISSTFLREIINSCESVYASNLPLKTRTELCGEIIFHDYSTLPPENFKDIRIFSDALLGKTVAKYQEGLRKTEKAREKLKKIGLEKIFPMKKVTDIIHIDQKLDDITFTLREANSSVQKAIKNNYYEKASKRSQRKFKTVVNHLVSGIEKILEDGKKT